MKGKKIYFALAFTLMLSATVLGCNNSKSSKDSSLENKSVEKEIKDATYQTTDPQTGDTIITISFKDYGDVKIKLFPKEAPKAVENFTTHAKEGYYDGLTMHRVISNFMIQGGDPNGDGTGGESIWTEPFEDEFVEYLNPIRGALCMANSGSNTNGSQFFIVQGSAVNDDTLKDLTDVQKEMYRTNGGCPWLTGAHTVFGQVYEGMDVVNTIAATQTDPNTDKPLKDVVISHITVDTY